MRISNILSIRIQEKKIKRYEKCKAQFFPVDSHYDYFSENVDNSTIDFGPLHQYL